MSTSTAAKSTTVRSRKNDGKEGDEHVLNKEMDKLMEEHARIQERLAETKPPPVDANEVGGIVDYDQDDDGAGEGATDGRAGSRQASELVRHSEELTEEQREKEAKARFIKSELGGFSEASPQIRESMKRNRRMFGNLLGHLGSARQRLENDRKRDAIQRQEECAQRVEAKLARQRNNLREIRRLEWEERRKQDRERLEQVLREMEVKKIELLKIRLQSHYKQMTGFIRTNAQPSVFYLPKHHNSESKELLDRTKEQIEQKIALIPYSFAEFAEPTSAVLAGGSTEEKGEEKNDVGKELEMGAVEESQERAREQVDEDDRKESGDDSRSRKRSRSRRRRRSRSRSDTRRRSRRSSRDDDEEKERPRRGRASASRSRSGGGRSRRRKRRGSSASREKRSNRR